MSVKQYCASCKSFHAPSASVAGHEPQTSGLPFHHVGANLGALGAIAKAGLPSTPAPLDLRPYEEMLGKAYNSVAFCDAARKVSYDPATTGMTANQGLAARLAGASKVPNLHLNDLWKEFRRYQLFPGADTLVDRRVDYPYDFRGVVARDLAHGDLRTLNLLGSWANQMWKRPIGWGNLTADELRYFAAIPVSGPVAELIIAAMPGGESHYTSFEQLLAAGAQAVPRFDLLSNRAYAMFQELQAQERGAVPSCLASNTLEGFNPSSVTPNAPPSKPTTSPRRFLPPHVGGLGNIARNIASAVVQPQVDRSAATVTANNFAYTDTNGTHWSVVYGNYGTDARGQIHYQAANPGYRGFPAYAVGLDQSGVIENIEWFAYNSRRTGEA